MREGQVRPFSLWLWVKKAEHANHGHFWPFASQEPRTPSKPFAAAPGPSVFETMLTEEEEEEEEEEKLFPLKGHLVSYLSELTCEPSLIQSCSLLPSCPFTPSPGI